MKWTGTNEPNFDHFLGRLQPAVPRVGGQQSGGCLPPARGRRRPNPPKPEGYDSAHALRQAWPDQDGGDVHG